MKLSCVSVCFIGVLLFGEVCCFWNLNEEYGGVLDSDSDSIPEELPTDEDYPQYSILDFGERNNPEENEVNTGENMPKPDFEVAPGEDEKTSSGGTDSGPTGPDVSFINSLAEKLQRLSSSCEAHQDEISKLKEANRELILKIDSIEQLVKTNNVILMNVRQEQQECSKKTLQKVLHVFNRIMRVRISASDISMALRAESNSSPGGNKPIVVRFTNFATKMKVLAASKRLSSTNISVSSDYSELVAQKRAALIPYLKQLKATGHRAFLLYDSLVVDGVRKSLEELKAIEQSEKDTSETEGQVEMVDDLLLK